MGDFERLEKAIKHALCYGMSVDRFRELMKRSVDGVDGDDFCLRCGLPLTQCICKSRKL